MSLYLQQMSDFLALCAVLYSAHSEHVNVVQVRPPMPPVFFFLVDVSMTAVSTGAVAAACSAINRALADLKVSLFTSLCVSSSPCRVLADKFLRCFVDFVVSVEFKAVYCVMHIFLFPLWSLACSVVLIFAQENPRTMVGIATFDSTVHFYNLNKNLQTVRVLCSSGIAKIPTSTKLGV